MKKYYDINKLFDENGEPVKVNIIIKRKNNYIDKVEELATVSKVNIFSMKNFKEILNKVGEIE